MSIKKRQLPPFDPAQQRERQGIESAVASIASSDSRLQPWWALYRNAHHHQRVAILSHLEAGEGTYAWHFHLVRKIDRSEQAELLAAMRSVLHTALDSLGLTITAEVPPGDGEPIAYIVFSVPVSADEARRRVEVRRAWNEEYSRQDGQMSQTLDAVRAALAAGQPLPKCPFCGSQLDMDVRDHALNTDRTNRRAVLACATPQCFMASIPMPDTDA